MRTDNYVSADSVLLQWARKNGLSVDTIYRDEIVRSISVDSVQKREVRGQKAQLWITPPDKFGNLEVHVAVDKWHHFSRATLQSLRNVLSSELQLLKDH